MDLQLKGRTALVTGASVGIGRGIAHALAAEGVRLALTARRMDKLQEVAGEIVAAGGAEPVIFEQDMLAEDAAPRIAQRALEGLGGVDILVNNAGGSRSFKDLHVSEEAWNEAITLNFHRPRQLGDALIDKMIYHCTEERDVVGAVSALDQEICSSPIIPSFASSIRMHSHKALSHGNILKSEAQRHPAVGGRTAMQDKENGLRLCSRAFKTGYPIRSHLPSHVDFTLLE
jgi:NAD(P)-dependent dehydrogenase (short-subunit alcohol dehydrogenase family)